MLRRNKAHGAFKSGLSCFLSAVLVLGLMPTPAIAQVSDVTETESEQGLVAAVEDEQDQIEEDVVTPSEVEAPETVAIPDAEDDTEANTVASTAEEAGTAVETIGEENLEDPAAESAAAPFDDAGSQDEALPANATADIDSDENLDVNTEEPVRGLRGVSSRSITELSLDERLSMQLGKYEEWVGHFTSDEGGTYTVECEYDCADVRLYSDEELTNAIEYRYLDSDEWFMGLRALVELQPGESMYVQFVDEGYGYPASVLLTEGISIACCSCGFSTVYATGEPVDIGVASYLSYYRDVEESYRLVYGDDYEIASIRDSNGTVLSDNPTEPGDYEVTLRGLGSFGGTITRTMTIRSPFNLEDATVSLTADACIYTGSPVHPNVTVTDGLGNVLTEGVDYELQYYQGVTTWYEDEGWWDYNLEPVESCIEVGSYYVRAVATDDGVYAGQTRDKSFYVGNPHPLPVGEPQFVTLGYGELLLGVFTAPTDGTYEFSTTNGISFSVYADSDLTSCLGECGLVEGDEVFCLELHESQKVFVVTVSGSAEGEDYSFSMIVSSLSGNDISSSLFSACFVGSSEVGSLGQPVDLPEIEVSYYHDEEGTVYLSTGTDYTVSGFQDRNGNSLSGAPSEPGYYYAVIAGVGDYTGQRLLGFRVVDAWSLSNASLSVTFVNLWTGDPIALAYTVVDAAGNALAEGEDYVLQYAVKNYDEETWEWVDYQILAEPPTELGSYVVRATAVDGSQYTSSTYWRDFYICESVDLALGEEATASGTFPECWVGRLEIPSDGQFSITMSDTNTYFWVYRVADQGMDQLLFEGPLNWYDGVSLQLSAGDVIYLVIREGDEYYSSSFDTSVTITYDSPYDIGRDGYSCGFVGNSSFVYTGEPVALSRPYVERYDEENGEWYRLTQDVDFEFVRYLDEEGNELESVPSAIGEYRAELRGIGDYSGTAYAWFYILDSKDLSHASIDLLRHDYVGTGEPVQLEYVAYDYAGQTLVEGVDFELSYAVEDDEQGPVELEGAPSEPGCYYVCLSATESSSYRGASAWFNFSIVDGFDLNYCNISIERTYCACREGQVQLPVVSVTDRSGNTLIEGTDYELAYAEETWSEDWGYSYEQIDGAPTEPGQYAVQAVGVVDGAYHGSTGYASFALYEVAELSIDQPCNFAIEPNGMFVGVFTAESDGLYCFETTSTGWGWCEFYDDEDLSSGVNYEGDGSLGGQSSRAWVKMQGGQTVYYCARPDYDSCVGTVLVTQVDHSDIGGPEYSCWLNGRNDVYYQGNPIVLPSICVYRQSILSDQNEYLVQGKDFEIAGYRDYDGHSYSEIPTDPGEYTVVLRGIGLYTGTTTVRFYVYDGWDMQSVDLRIEDYNLRYTGEPQEPEVTVRDRSGNTLTRGIQYELVYISYEEETWDEIELTTLPTDAGYYEVKAVATDGSDYHGQTYTYGFSISDFMDLKNAEVQLDQSYYRCEEGQAVHAAVRVLDQARNTLTEGTDYDLVYGQRVLNNQTGVHEIIELDGAPDAPGEYYVWAKAAEGSAYSGTTYQREFVIYQATALSVEEPESFAVGETWYEFTAPTFGTYVFEAYSDGASWIEETICKDSEFKNHIPWRSGDESDGEFGFRRTYEMSAGETVYLRVYCYADDGTVQGTMVVHFLDPYDFGSPYYTCWVDNNVEYTGNPVAEPNITVRRTTAGRNYYLNQGTDFEVVGYKDNEGNLLEGQPVETGYYSAVIEGRGRYKGTAEVWFSVSRPIDPTDLEACAWLSFSEPDFDPGPTTFIYLRREEGFRPTVTVTRSALMDDGPLVEGIDYTLDFVEGEIVDGEQRVTVTATGKGAYHGTITASYLLVDQLDLSQFTVYVSLNGDVQSYSGNSQGPDGSSSSNILRYFYTGKAIKPVVSFSDRGLSPQYGEDYTVTYLDVWGNVIDEPIEQSYYAIRVDAVEGSGYKGSIEIPFRISYKKSLVNLDAPGFSYDGAYTSLWDNTFSIKDTIDAAGRVVWSFVDNLLNLVEGLDYTVQTVRDEVYGHVTYSFKGIGEYEGTVRSYVYVQADRSAVFASLLDDGYSIATVRQGDDGQLLVPEVSLGDLILGVDYQVDGVYDEAGTALSTADVGTYVYVGVTGLGTYAGCSGYVPARVIDAPAKYDLASASVQVVNGAYASGYGFYVLASDGPHVQVRARAEGMPEVLLEEGQGFSVEQELLENGETLLTLTADEGSLLSGSTTVRGMKLVDAFDLGTLCIRVRLKDMSSQQQYYIVGETDEVSLSYAGIPYVPSIEYIGYYRDGEQVQADVALLDASGQQVDAITGAGSYTMVLSGVGCWIGSISVPLTVTEAPAGVYLSTCDLTVGEAVLVDGKAEPEVTLSFGGHQYTEGVDYTVTYGNNDEAGKTGWVKVVGAEGSNFLGWKAASFEVAGAPVATDLSSTAYDLQLPYDGVWVSYSTLAHTNLINPSVRGISNALIAYPLGRNGLAEPTVRVVGPDGSELDSTLYSVTYGNNAQEGVAYVTVAGTGDYSGSKSCNFYVWGADTGTELTGDMVSDVEDVTYNGVAQEPTVTVTYEDNPLVKDVDYEVSYSGNVEVGQATITVTGIGEYSGVVTKTFQIQPKGVTITAADCSKVFGEADPELAATVEGLIGSDEVQYALSRAAGEGVGTYAITPTGEELQGNYTLTFVPGTLAITAKALTADMLSVDDQTYAGDELRPLVVKDGEGTLVEGTDYTATYTDNVNVGTVTVSVEGEGNYQGVVGTEFQILPKDVTVTAANLSKAYGDADPELAATVEGLIGSDEVQYALSRTAGEGVGTYAITVTGDELQGNYQVTFVPGTLTISAKALTEDMVAALGARVYNGKAIEPAISVTNGEVTLIKGVDYGVAYSQNLNVGTAQVTITGIGGYSGEVVRTFQIMPKGVTITAKSCSKGYGTADPTLTASVVGLVDDFVPSYELVRDQGEEVGTYAITVTGEELQGNYTLTFVPGTLDITAKVLTEDMVSAIDDQTYVGQALEPGVAVTDGATVLVAGTDYEIAYSDNVNAGTGKVTITGKGNYGGSLEQEFTISKAKQTIAASNKSVAMGKTVSVAAELTAGDGKLTYKSSDTTVAKVSSKGVITPVGVGTAKVTVTAAATDNYAKATKTITVTVTQGTQTISASNKSVAMGKTVSVAAELTAGDGKLTYKSSDTTVAKVSSKGVITPVGVGTAKVTVTAAATDNYAKATKTITVTVTQGTQTISASNKSVKSGKTVSLGATTSGGTKLTYATSDATIATVSAKGVVTGKNVGTATITITAAANTNWKKATKTVTVKVTALSGTWKQSGSKWWYEWSDGTYPKSQFLTISGKTYYFDKDGWMLTGWQQIGGKYYYFGSDGVMAKSKWVGDYYLGKDGVMLVSTVTPDGWQVDANGKAVKKVS